MHLLALTFVHPLMLGGLGLAAAPILIHLLSRRRFRRIPWGATLFLRQAERENRRRIRFEQWLLVALRSAALALLALVFARPFVQPGRLAALLGGTERTRRVVVLDDSASLAWRAAAEADFARAVRAAIGILNGLHHSAPDDPLAFYLTSHPDEPLLDGPLDDAARRTLEDRLSRAAPVSQPADPRGLFERLAARFGTGGPVRTDVFVVSDFQRSDWIGADAGGRSAFSPLAESSRPGLRVVLVAAAAGARENVALRGLALERRQTLAGLGAIVRGEVANQTRRGLSELRARIEVDGAPLAPIVLEPAAPGATRAFAAEVAFEAPGFHELSATVDALDGFAADDTARLAVAVREALVVLLVNGRPDADPQRDAAHLLRSALSPPGPFASGVRVETIDPSDLEAADLDAFDAVVLCDAPPPTPPAALALERFVRRGGGVVLFLGREAGDGSEYNAVLYRDGAGLLPLPLLGPRDAEGASGCTIVREGEHPVTAMFAGGAAAGSESARFRRFHACGPPASPGPLPPPVVLARFSDADGSPAWVERPFGDGRALLFTSSADLSWGDWPRAPDGSFVVTMLEVVHYVARPPPTCTPFLGGQTLEVELTPEVYEAAAVFRSPAHPDDPPVEGRVVSRTEARVVVAGPRAERLGFYHAELVPRGLAASSMVEIRPLAVNLDPIESDPNVASRAELSAALGGIPHEVLSAAEEPGFEGGQARRELWPGLLTLLVATLMIEQSLAWWFGRTTFVARPGRPR